MHPATGFQIWRRSQYPRITDIDYLQPSRHQILLILSENKVHLMSQMRNIWQPHLPFAIIWDFWKLHAQIQILVETSLSHSGLHLERSRRVLRTIEFYAAAEKNCFKTSDFHSKMHPATGFQNLTHLRIFENHRYSLVLDISASIFAHTFWKQSSFDASDA